MLLDLDSDELADDKIAAKILEKNGGKLSAICSELQPTEPSLWQAEPDPRGQGNEAGIEPASCPFTIQ